VGGGSGGGGEPFLGGDGADEAVGEDGGRVVLAAQAGLDEAPSVVQDHHRMRQLGLLFSFFSGQNVLTKNK
jgi:hypothetical protein